MKLAQGLTLPIEAVTQTFGFVGKRGAGKSYGALKLAELFLDSGAQVVAIDPVGNWWGLRLAADGKGKGFDVPVLGGHRGDLPLEPGAGALIADLVVDRHASLILDVSQMTQGELKRFAREFGERLLQRKKGEAQPTPMHLFIEEAQELIPERTSGGDIERMKAAFVRIVKLGRNWGIGVTLITQRPQAVSKEALNQTECLVALQTVGAHERKAVREWIRFQGQEEKLADLLPALQKGEGYVWSPSWLGKLERVRIAVRTTFDASATPTMAGAKKGSPGAGAVAAPLNAADLEALRASMAEVVKKAEASDPKLLRRRIADLEATVRRLEASPKSVPPPAVSPPREVPVLKEAQVKRLEAMVARLDAHGAKVCEASAEVTRVLAEATKAAHWQTPPAVTPHRQAAFRQVTAGRQPVTRNRQEGTQPRNGSGLIGGARRMLQALASFHPRPLTRVQVATLAVLSPGSGTFGNYLGDLRRGGFVSEQGESLTATREGLAYLDGDYPDTPTSTEALLALWTEKFTGGARRMLEILVDRYPKTMTRTELAEAAGVSPGSGTFGNYLGDLRRNRLIEEPERGLVCASGSLFLGAEEVR